MRGTLVFEPTPAERLLIKPGTAVWMSHPERITVLEPWPNDTSQVGAVAQAGVALLFADDDAVLCKGLDRALADVPAGVSIWVVHRGLAGAQVLERLSATLVRYGLEPQDHLQLNGRWAALRVASGGPAPGAEPQLSLPR
jgi:hypothetical protein